MQHKHEPDNNWETPFDFTDENYERVKLIAMHVRQCKLCTGPLSIHKSAVCAQAAELLANYPTNYKASAMIPILDLAQIQNNGWLSLSAMNKVSTEVQYF